jgi:hypothetical protein
MGNPQYFRLAFLQFIEKYALSEKAQQLKSCEFGASITISKNAGKISL